MKTLIFAGSTRKDSLNKKVARHAERLVKQLGYDATFIDLRDYPLQLYDGDDEVREFPKNAILLKKIFDEHDAFIIASPEYNSSISGVLKNTLDWVSRVHGDEKPMQQFVNKTALILSASPSAHGGLRTQFATRYVLMNMGVIVLPSTITFGHADQKLDGVLDEQMQDKMSTGITTLARVSAALKEN